MVRTACLAALAILLVAGIIATGVEAHNHEHGQQTTARECSAAAPCSVVSDCAVPCTDREDPGAQPWLGGSGIAFPAVASTPFASAPITLDKPPPRI